MPAPRERHNHTKDTEVNLLSILEFDTRDNNKACWDKAIIVIIIDYQNRLALCDTHRLSLHGHLEGKGMSVGALESMSRFPCVSLQSAVTLTPVCGLQILQYPSIYGEDVQCQKPFSGAKVSVWSSKHVQFSKEPCSAFSWERGILINPPHRASAL